MTHEFLPFAKPSINQKTIDDVIDCLESGWITTGPRVQHFEEKLRDYFQSPYALALSSGTAGLHLALLSLALQPGDEVITTAFTFVATLNAIIHAGGKPVLVDIDPSTFNLAINAVEKAITPKTKAILPVHFAGLPVDLDAIYTLAEQHNLRVIEDAAHAMGAAYKEKKIGEQGDIQIFSFHPNKNMTTGEGGCVVTYNEQTATFIKQMRFHGIDRDAWNRYAKEGSQEYVIHQPGFKYNMMDLQAAIGINQIDHLDDFNQKRDQLAQRYLEKLADWPEVTLPKASEYSHQHAWHLFTVLINPEAAAMDRNTFMHTIKSYNIGTGLHYYAPHLFPFYQREYGYQRGDFPQTEKVSDRIVSLPLFPDLSHEQQDYVINTMSHLLKKR